MAKPRSQGATAPRNRPASSSSRPKQAAKPAPKQAQKKDNSVFIARAAIALCRLPDDTKALFTVPEARMLAAEVSAKYRQALADDWRVGEVLDELPDGQELDNARTETFFEISPDAEDLTDAIESYEAMRFNSPIYFRISVLAKNQPRYRSMEDVPSDNYLVVWDGIHLCIQWEQDSPRATGSGGHVVFEVLAAVGEATGYPVRILACSPGCHHKFVHGDFVTFAEGEPADDFHPHGETPVGSTIHTPFLKDTDDVRNIARTFYSIDRLLGTFAQAKTYFDAISYLEWRARRDSRILLAIAYDQASRRRVPNFVGALKDLWDLRGSRRAKRSLMAGLWLALASMDTFRVTWRRYDAKFSELVSDPRIGKLAVLFDTGHDFVEAQDMTVVSTSLQEVATRIEGGRLFVATLAAAAAAFLAAFLTALFTAD